MTRVSTRLIKKHRHYEYYEAADALGLTTRTIRSWRHAGLRVMTDQRPHLILGEDLIGFVKERQKPKQKMAPDQFRCFNCKRPTRPLDRIVFYTPMTAGRGQLECACEACESQCFRFAGAQSLIGLGQFFEIVSNDSSQA